MKQLAIMRAAEETFLKKPYSAITVNEIARKAGVTKRTLYSYFPSKLALFIQMFEDYLQKMHKRILAAGQSDLPPYERFINVINEQFAFNQEHHAFMRLFWTLDSDEFDGEIPEELKQSIRFWNRDMIDIAVKIIEEGQSQGIFAGCEPEMLVHMMSAFNKGVVIHTSKEARLNIASVSPEKLQKLFMELLTSGFFKK
jgi:TetR/AcrR family fatty acid metabolism transcriptional regulator